MKTLVLAILALFTPQIDGYQKLTSEAIGKVVTIGVVGPDLHGYIGSGAFISEDGYVLTCAHLFSHDIPHAMLLVKTSGGKRYLATLVDIDPKHDLALIKINARRKLPYFTLGEPVTKGQVVLALGAPLGIESTVSVGYVENVSVGKEVFTLHSAPTNPGNSGGPLIDSTGRLVGVNVSMYMANIFAAANSLFNAVNINQIKDFLDER